MRSGNLIYTSGQVCAANGKGNPGKVGEDVSLVKANNAAKLRSYKCLQAAGSIANIHDLQDIVKVLRMISV